MVLSSSACRWLIATLLSVVLGPGFLTTLHAEDHNKPIQAERGTLAIIVNGRNPVSTLERDQVAAIYQQRIQRWREVGGVDRPIVRLTQGVSPFAGASGSEPVSGVSARPVSSDLATILFVAVDPYAIGYVSAATARQLIREGARIRIVQQIARTASP